MPEAVRQHPGAAPAPRCEPLPVTVVIPTVGRPDLLRRCVASIVAARPSPAEVLVADQSGDDASRDALGDYSAAGVHVVECAGRGAARAMNAGLSLARHDVVLITNDDCTVDRDWVAVAWRHLLAHPDGIVTGQVRPGGGGGVPSTKVAEQPHDYTGQIVCGGLYAANMAGDRRAINAFGGFDERHGFVAAAQDNDLCYRWLRAGRELRFEPRMIVWHHDWRTPQQLAARYRDYAVGQGALYAKHLHAGDLRILRFLVRDLYYGLRYMAARIVRRRPSWRDERSGILAGLPRGILGGLREARRLAATSNSSPPDI